MIKTKTCPKCEIEKPESEYHKCSSHTSGLATYCKKCTKEIGRKPQVKIPEQKECPSCNQILPASGFYITKTRISVYCKKCHGKKVKKHHDRISSSMDRLINRARKKNLPHEKKEILLEWYKSQQKICHYCKLPEDRCLPAKRKDTRLHIDRKNNDQGYTINNMALACFRCNTIKGAWLTEEQMLEVAQKYFLHKPPI